MSFEGSNPSLKETQVDSSQTESLEPKVIQEIVDMIGEKPKEKIAEDVGKSFTPPTESEPLVIEESTDPDEYSLEQYRAQAIEQILEAMQAHQFVHIDTLSGSGMSSFIVPKISNSYLAEGRLPSITDLREIIDENGIETIILDELGWNSTFLNDPQKYADELKALAENYPKLKFIIAVGRTEKTAIQLDAIATSVEPVSIKVGRKAFNNRQAIEYIQNKCPNLQDLDDETRGMLLRYIVDKKGEFGDLLHFRWMRKVISEFDWVFPHDHEVGEEYSEDELQQIRDDLTEQGVLAQKIHP